MFGVPVVGLAENTPSTPMSMRRNFMYGLFQVRLLMRHWKFPHWTVQEWKKKCCHFNLDFFNLPQFNLQVWKKKKKKTHRIVSHVVSCFISFQWCASFSMKLKPILPACIKQKANSVFFSWIFLLWTRINQNIWKFVSRRNTRPAAAVKESNCRQTVTFFFYKCFSSCAFFFKNCSCRVLLSLPAATHLNPTQAASRWRFIFFNRELNVNTNVSLLCAFVSHV